MLLQSSLFFESSYIGLSGTSYPNGLQQLQLSCSCTVSISVPSFYNSDSPYYLSYYNDSYSNGDPRLELFPIAVPSPSSCDCVPEAIPRDSQRQRPHVNPPISLYRMRHWDDEGTAAVTGAGTPISWAPPAVQPGLPAPSNHLYDNTGTNAGMGSSRNGYIVPHRASTPYSQFPHNSGSQGAVPWDSPVLPFIPPVIPPPLPDTPGIDSVSGVWPGPFPPFPPPILPASSSFLPGFVQTGQIFGQPFGQWAGQPSGPSVIPNNIFSPQNLLKPHPRFYFADGGLIIQVTDTLYKIHSVFIQQHAPSLQPSIQHGIATARYGSSSHLQLYGVEPSQFDLVLSLFYPKSLLKHEPESVFEWLDVLHVSSTLHMPEIFSLAVFQLTLLASPVQKIEWGHRYNVKKWLVPAFMELVGRMEDINLEEKKKIGERGRGQLWGALTEKLQSLESGDLKPKLLGLA
ncbi:hypothetical protein F5050DRAFT_1712009 [Lentinula boryana]|uniref:BTB domain-containing protein n=1 Tax=Lentinula boryana TaxID=40481 RepID=A0ABQ8QDS1_9AGAR|nr:hypothetical protein F5050DRAFT_1712009 [Lentinula boryana]